MNGAHSGIITYTNTKLEKEKESLSGQIARVQYQFEESQQMIQNQV